MPPTTNKLPEDDRPTMTPKMIAESLAISLSSARFKLQTGEIPGVKVGKYRRTTPRQFREYLASRATGVSI